MPSVVMNDEIPMIVVTTPLMSPMSAHPTSASTRLSISGIPSSVNHATMNAASANTCPTDRSISPEIIRKTSPAAMIAVAAMNVPSVCRFAVEAKSVTVYRKYTYSATPTTAMLSSRRSSATAATRANVARRRLGPGGAAVSGLGSESVVVTLVVLLVQMLREGPLGLLDDLLVLRRPLEARRAAEVGRGVVLGEELQAGVHVAGAGEGAGDLRQEQLDDRIEPLDVGLLVDREVELVVAQQLERLGQRVVAAALHALVAQLVLLDDLADRLRRAGVDREHALDVLVAEVVRVDARELLVELGTAGDRLVLDVLAGLLDRVDRAVDAWLDVQRAGRGDEQRDLAGRDQLDDPLAHLDARQEQVLADVGEAVVRRVGVVGDHRNPRVERPVGRVVERLGVDQADGDAVRLAADRGVHRVDHLADVRGLRARPLEGRVQQRARVLRAVLRGREERIRRHVVDEDELVLRRDGEVAGAALGGGRPVVVVVAGLAAGGERAGEGDAAARERAAAQEGATTEPT